MLDLKNILIGFLLAACIFILTGFSFTDNGRYQTMSPLVVLDTATGDIIMYPVPSAKQEEFMPVLKARIVSHQRSEYVYKELSRN